MADFKPKDPNYICTFSITKNANKDLNNQEHKNRPDYVLVNSVKKNKKGDFFKKNFTINGSWCEASGYKQPDNTLKITVKKTGSTGTQTQDSSGFSDQF